VHELLDRFCRYVKVETTSDQDSDRYPSTPGQLELGRLLVEELLALGLLDVGIDEQGLVTGTVPGNVEGAPTIAWFAHLDTSPEASGKGVQPTIHRDYDGEDIVLPGDPSKVIRVAETEALAELVGKTLITSDGTTLLGADDKAGVAVIVTAAAMLMDDPSIKHGPIRVLFTIDEEICRGTDKVDVGKIGATCGYTLDAEGQGKLENETFSADMATITITGVSIHPGLAYGKLVNAVRLAAELIDRLPRDMAPETTAGRDGFLHLDTIEGRCSSRSSCGASSRGSSRCRPGFCGTPRRRSRMPIRVPRCTWPSRRSTGTCSTRWRGRRARPRWPSRPSGTSVSSLCLLRCVGERTAPG